MSEIVPERSNKSERLTAEKSIITLNYSVMIKCKFFRDAVLTAVMITAFQIGAYCQSSDENAFPHLLYPEFRKGVVIMKSDTPVTALFNYNMLNEMMITELNGVYRYINEPKLIDTIYIGADVFIPVGGKFYELLSAGRVTFFVQNKAVFVEEGSDVGYGARSKTTGTTQVKKYELRNPGQILDMDTPDNGEVRLTPVFWVSMDGSLEKFNNERQLVKLFPQHKEAIHKFIESEDISLRVTEDVTRLGDYINSVALNY